MSPTILKIGGSVITDKNREGKAKIDLIKRISREIACYPEGLVLVHGAGSFGHPQAKRYGLTEKFDARGLIITHNSVKILNGLVVGALLDSGLLALPLHPLDFVVLEGGRIKAMELYPLKLMLERGIIPVLHGDVAMDTKLGASILSGDQLVAYLAIKLGASRIGAGSNVDGVLDEEGKMIPKITPGSFEAIKSKLGESRAIDITGGMLNKVQEFLGLSKLGICSCIFNASKEGLVERFLQGEAIGTIITDK